METVNLFFGCRKQEQTLIRLKNMYEGYDISDPTKVKKAAGLWKKIGCPYQRSTGII